MRKEANAKYHELADAYCNTQRKETSNLFAKAQKQKDPAQFLRFKDPELKLNDIKKALKEGATIPGAVLEETESVVIK